MKTYKLNLSETEKQALRQCKIKLSSLADYTADELSIILNSDSKRADEIAALIAFQSIPSIGPKFAWDLIGLGYYTLNQLAAKNGSDLLNDYERMHGFRTDPCVEDQFWLVVHYAQNPKSNKNWWDFTPLRKAYREQNGYPATRPNSSWFEMPQYN